MAFQQNVNNKTMKQYIKQIYKQYTKISNQLKMLQMKYVTLGHIKHM